MVDINKVFDENGDSMDLLWYKESRLVGTDGNLETLNNLSKLPVREDDIFLCSYAKSGCHWLWEIIRLLKFGSIDKLEPVDKERCMIEINSFDSLAELKSPKILNNHGLVQDQPSDLFTKKVKVIFVYRNIKDVAVSYYHHHIKFSEYAYKASFSNYLKRFVAGLVDGNCVFDYLKEWEDGILNNPNLTVHVVSYEDLKQDTVGEVKKLSHFLGTSQDLGFLQHVVDATDIGAMKKRKMLLADAYKDNDGQLIMYRKGQVGDWKNHFTVTESEWMDSLIEKHLGNSKLYNFKYTI